MKKNMNADIVKELAKLHKFISDRMKGLENHVNSNGAWLASNNILRKLEAIMERIR